MSGNQQDWAGPGAGCGEGCVRATWAVEGWGWGELCRNLFVPPAGISKCGLGSCTGPLLVPRCASIFIGVDGKITCAPLPLGTCLDTIVCFAIAPYALGDTHSHHLLWDTPVPCVVSLAPPRIRPCPCLHVSWKAVSACRNPRAFRSGAGHCSFKGGGRQRAHGSVNFQLTPRLEAHGIILRYSEALPASPDAVSPSFLTRRGPKSHLKRSPETPADALELPLHRWQSAPGGPEDRIPGGLALGRLPSPTPPPTGPRIQPPQQLQQEPPCRPAAAIVSRGHSLTSRSRAPVGPANAHVRGAS
ncbi:uncharacterized protein LOC103888605 [Pongo abelii]|uniref:uncharacterized protein LOC103888605 n=1 Tax=Pongo abelii TaxID=9601 RepID=UPI0023E82EDD|nr:uncharacterized protein LOC103888605 [Pongo abelii]XP_054396399.1 uncharacterized protein LOC103888605 [Pongo abelii]XP_054396400.1 uncharacterized protein LOC103888605 [Pongo abelii]